MNKLFFQDPNKFNHLFKSVFCLLSIFFFSLILSACLFKPFLNNRPFSQNQGIYSIPNLENDLVGQNITVTAKQDETLQSIGLSYDVGEIEMQQANPSISSWKTIAPETTVMVPTQYILPPKQYRQGIVINIAELRLYYFDQADQTVMTFPIALGREGWRTPIGKTYVVKKQENPSWHVPKSIREYTYQKTGKQLPAIIPPGENNPLGRYAIYLGFSGYLIHGTNDHASIGKLVSSGCIRMHNKDIVKIFDQIKKGTPVYIIYYPNKVGWLNNQLYLESHKSVSHDKGLYAQYEVPIHSLIQEAIINKPIAVNWNKVHTILMQHTGIPEVIGNEKNED